jgi:D-serine deaminase-like pyridoxal phosphate-dependent protein
MRCGRGVFTVRPVLPPAPSSEDPDRTIASLETPSVVVDLDRLERNIERWAASVAATGMRWWAHVKTHKTLEIARMAEHAGAVGLVCQKLSEAEVYAAAGHERLLIPYNLLGAAKLDRLSALLATSGAEVTVSVDDARLVDGLADAARRTSRTLRVLVECETGHGRAGVASATAAAQVAVSVARSRNLRFQGLLTYPWSPAALDRLEEAAEAVRREGLDVAELSIGGTPRMWDAAQAAGRATDYRIGNHVFFDRRAVGEGVATPSDVALTVLATVVSRPTATRAALDAGSKTLGADVLPSGATAGFGIVEGRPGVLLVGLSEEHAHVRTDDARDLALGERVRVQPNHACVVPNLTDVLHVVRGERLVATWPVVARGAAR